MDTPLSLADRLAAAGTSLVIARASFDIWWLYAGRSTRSNFLSAINEYSDFFRFDEEAHFRLAIISVFTLFDGRGDTVTLTALADECTEAGYDTDSIRKRIKTLCPVLKKIKILRHKLFAHRDNRLTYEQVYESAGITPHELESLLDECLSIINALAEFCGSQPLSFNEYVASDTKALLDKIQSA